MATAQRYRYDQVRKWHSELKDTIDKCTTKIKKYKRHVIMLDTTVYSVSAVVASTGVLLSALTPETTAIAITITISTSTTIAGIANIIAKKISSCALTKLHEYEKLNSAAKSTYSKLSSLISSSLYDTTISDFEFVQMAGVYNDYTKNFDLKRQKINNDGITSADSRKYKPGANIFVNSNIN